MKQKIKWKNALITGASSGIGLEFANQLAQYGVNLLLIARNRENLEIIKIKLESENKNKVEILSLDLISNNSVEEILSFIRQNNFHPDLLINNAGAGVYGRFESTDLQKEIDVINLNIIALTKLTKLTLPMMIENGGGNILNVSSTIAFRKSPNWTVYSATKAYIFSLTRSLSIEYFKSNIKFSVLCPGRTSTSFDINAGVKVKSKVKKAKTADIVSYTIKQLHNNKILIIPGFKNKIKYYAFKLLPEFFTDMLIKSL